jgi:DNA repair protein RecO (recombination protein O)
VNDSAVDSRNEELELVFNTEAIVVRSIAYGENHAIVTLLTPTGKLAALARGAKKPQSRMAAGVQLCVQGIYSVRRRSGMGTLLQVEITNSRRRLREQLELAAYAAYFAELVERAADDAPDGSESLYRLFEGALDRLVEHPEQSSITALMWEAKILLWLGASPDWQRCVRCGRPLAEVATTSTGDLGYSPADGGLVCPACQEPATDGREVLRVPVALARVLHQFSRIPWSQVRSVRLSAASQGILRRILRHQLSEFAGLSLRSQRFLDSLDL